MLFVFEMLNQITFTILLLTKNAIADITEYNIVFGFLYHNLF